MANFQVRDGALAEKYLKATGAGSDVDPFVVEHKETSAASIKTAVELLDDCVFADDAAFTPGTSKVIMIGCQYDDSSPDSVNEGDAGAPRMSARREVYCQLRDAAGNERGLYVDANGEIGIGSVRTSITPGTSAAHLGKQVDAVAGGSDTGVAMLAVRDDSLSTLTPAEGDYVQLRVDSEGRLHVTGTTAVTFEASEDHIGQVGAPSDLIDVTLSLDTGGAYSSGDVLADTQTITNAVRVSGGRAVLQSVTVIDEDDQGAAFDLVFLDTNNSLGTENSSPSISDANARTVLGFVSIASTDYIDLGGVRVATKTGIGLVLEATGSTRDLYLGAISRGTPTHAASGLRLRLGLLQD